jgi:hypothetical protein
MGKFGEGGDGALSQRLAALDAMTPEQQRALIESSLASERMRSLDASSGENESMLRRQLEQARQMAFTPVEVQGRTPVAQGASLAANALRMIGGLVMSSQRERDLKAARAESEAGRQKLFDSMGQGAGIVIDNDREGARSYLGRSPMSRALLKYGVPDSFGRVEL